MYIYSYCVCVYIERERERERERARVSFEGYQVQNRKINRADWRAREKLMVPFKSGGGIPFSLGNISFFSEVLQLIG